MGKKGYFAPSKFTKKDNSWLSQLGEKREKFLRKLVWGMNFSREDISLPFDLKIASVEMVYRGNEESWFHDKLDDFKLLVRVKGLDEEGIGMHLTETAKVIRWTLWAPLLGEPDTSKQAPDRMWRENTFTNPANFLLSYIDDSKVDLLEDLVSDRWDSRMMFGGAEKVKNLIHKYISKDNEELKRKIKEWLSFLKWHQEFDWDEVSGNVLFGSNYSKLKVFWENEEYKMSETYSVTTLWATNKPNTAQNIREVLAKVPGFENLKDTLELEAEDKKRTPSRCKIKAKVKSCTSSIIPFLRPQKTTFPTVRFRPDLPFNGENKIAFENNYIRHTNMKNNTSNKKRSFTSDATVDNKLNESSKQRRIQDITNLKKGTKQSCSGPGKRSESQKEGVKKDTYVKNND